MGSSAARVVVLLVIAVALGAGTASASVSAKPKPNKKPAATFATAKLSCAKLMPISQVESITGYTIDQLIPSYDAKTGAVECEYHDAALPKYTAHAPGTPVYFLIRIPSAPITASNARVEGVWAKSPQATSSQCQPAGTAVGWCIVHPFGTASIVFGPNFVDETSRYVINAQVFLDPSELPSDRVANPDATTIAFMRAVLSRLH